MLVHELTSEQCRDILSRTHRVLLLIQLDMGALAGYTGAVFERFFVTTHGSLWSGAALAAWAIVPFFAAMRRFAHRDF